MEVGEHPNAKLLQTGILLLIVLLNRREAHIPWRSHGTVSHSAIFPV